MTNHTPAPWASHTLDLRRGIGSLWGIHSKNGNVVDVLTDCPERRANAALIAASPKMLAALKAVLPSLDRQNSVTIERGSACWEQIEAAIAQAEGRG